MRAHAKDHRSRATAKMPLLVSLTDAAKILGISRSSFYKLLNTGQVRYVRIGDRRLVGIDELYRFIEANEIGNAMSTVKPPVRRGRAQ